MFTIDSKRGLEVLEGFESSLRLLRILFKITYDAELRIVALRLLNSVNEFLPGRGTIEDDIDVQ